MSDRAVKFGLVCWFGSVPLLFWTGVGGPTAAGVAGVLSFIVGGFCVAQWAAAGGIPRGMVR